MARVARPDPAALASSTLGEEIANAVTHGLGAVLAVAALVLLVVRGALAHSPLAIAAGIVFGLTLIFLYLSSTLYHAIPSPRAKHVLKVLDHSSIYLLIAATYTPFTLISLRGPTGLTIFAVVWGIALVGVALEAFWVYRPRWVSAVTFLGMGWIVVVAIKPLMNAVDPSGLWLLVAGGLSYTGGTIFYVLKRVPYMHAVWHLFVLGGSVCHVLAVLLYVIPKA